MLSLTSPILHQQGLLEGLKTRRIKELNKEKKRKAMLSSPHTSLPGLDAATSAIPFIDPFAAHLSTLPATINPDALTHAAQTNNLPLTLTLLSAGGDPSPASLPASHSPLFLAARAGHLRVTQLLLAERLRRGLWGEDRHLRDGRVLREAEERGDVEMVVLLTMAPEDVLSAEDMQRGREGGGKRDSVLSI